MKTDDKNKKTGSNKNYRSKSNKNRKSSRSNSDTRASRAPAATGVTPGSALLSAAANLSFPTTAGYPINVVRNTDLAIMLQEPVFRIPGVMRFGYMPAMGPMRNWTDPANVWLRDVFTFLRHVNSGHTNYSAAAVGTYFYSIRSARDYLMWMIRLYGTMMGSYVPTNAYTPRDIVRAMDGDYDDLIDKLANLRFYIASYAARLNQMKVPNLRFFSQGNDVLSNIYADTDMDKASYYVFTPDAYWYFYVGATAEETCITTVDVPTGTLESIKVTGELLLNSIMNNEDFNIMSGDILKAYTDLLPIPVIDESYSVGPIYDPAMLWCIHNASFLFSNKARAQKQLKKWKIYQDLSETINAGALIFESPVTLDIQSGYTELKINNCLVATIWNSVLDAPTAQCDPATVALLSRFKVFTTFHKVSESDNGGYFSVDTPQFEIVTSASFLDMPGAFGFHEATMMNYAAMSRFDYLPYIWDMRVEVNEEHDVQVTCTQNNSILGDVTNPTTLTQEVAENVAMALALDMFGSK